MQRKKLLWEVFWIVLLSGAMGLLYNVFRDKPLPFISKSAKELKVSDSLLFGTVNPIDTTKQPIAQPAQPIDTEKKIDTSKKVRELALAEPQIKDKPPSDALDNKQNKFNNSDKTSGEFKLVTYEQILKAMNRADFLLVDARRVEDYAKSHIGNAINIYPLIEYGELMDKLSTLPRDKTIIIYCDGGDCDLSHEVAKNMVILGFDRVYIYKGGWDEWKKKQPK
jgi:rhodanese-related sulfurtransferase